MSISTAKRKLLDGDNIIVLPRQHERSGQSGGNGRSDGKLTSAQREWLSRGLEQPGGKLPLFDRLGQKVNERTIRACIRHGWAEPWFENPIKADWLVCRLTDAGRDLLDGAS